MFHIYVWCLVYMEIRTVVHDHNSLLSPSSYSHKLTHYNKNGSKNTNKRLLNFFHNIISVWHYYIMSVEIEVTYNTVAVDYRRPPYDLISHLLTYFLASSSFKNNSNNNFNNKFRKTLLESSKCQTSVERFSNWTNKFTVLYTPCLIHSFYGS